MNRDPDLRWQQRLQSFERALSLLEEVLDRGPAALNQLEKEGSAIGLAILHHSHR